jgi:hypothetical protein
VQDRNTEIIRLLFREEWEPKEISVWLGVSVACVLKLRRAKHVNKWPTPGDPVVIIDFTRYTGHPQSTD